MLLIMKESCRFILLIFFVGLLPSTTSPLLGQSDYIVDYKKEEKYILTGTSLLLLSGYLREKTNPLDAHLIAALSTENIPSFDVGATMKHDEKADLFSDVGFYSSIALPASLYLFPKINKKRLTILWGETVIITSGATLLSKYLTKRPRPYMYNPTVPVTEKMDKNGLTSFFSGHTSLTAANAFFAAKMINDYYPEGPIKYIAWTLAATWPAFTGYMRIESGNHFLSDVVTGYLFGASVGVLIPYLHRNKKISSAWKISSSANGICLSYSLN